jgi:hypothetical protein
MIILTLESLQVARPDLLPHVALDTLICMKGCLRYLLRVPHIDENYMAAMKASKFSRESAPVFLVINPYRPTHSCMQKTSNSVN